MGRGGKMSKVRKMSLIGILTALAVVLSVLEQYVPIQALLPLPGIKLGIANVVTLTALKQIDFKSALSILVVRCCIVALLFGTPVSLAMSLSGGVAALLVMYFLLKKSSLFSLFGVSITGAAFHNIGQVICASIVLQSHYVLAYLPILLISAFLTGTLIALLVGGCLKFLNKIQL